MKHINPKGEMPFLDHLEELRWRILKAGGALLVGSMIGLLLVHQFSVTEILIRPIRPYLENQGGRLAAFSPVTPFLFELKLALLVGIVLSLPIIIWHVWAFLSPALESHERKVVVPSLYAGLVLFSIGVAGAYLMLPLFLRALFKFQSDYLNLVIGANEYFGFVIRLLLAFGVVFEMPVVVMILTALGIVEPSSMRKGRRYAIAIMTVLSALITPPDVFSMTVILIPFVLLYESSILLSALLYRRREGPMVPDESPPEGAEEAETEAQEVP
jgi:sec-independent protein translocase protein TatC